MDITIAQLDSLKQAPMDLLLLADPSEKLVKQYLEKGYCYVAKLENEVVGVVLIMRTSDDTYEIMNIAVRVDKQNQGIAKKLIAYAKNQAKQLGAAYLEIGTGNPGVVQMLLYQKCGFRIIGVDLDFFRRTHDEKIFENGIECRDMIRMAMEL
jgi:ribosomal protein S18 acetylase RimI-like enzyme